MNGRRPFDHVVFLFFKKFDYGFRFENLKICLDFWKTVHHFLFSSTFHPPKIMRRININSKENLRYFFFNIVFRNSISWEAKQQSSPRITNTSLALTCLGWILLVTKGDYFINLLQLWRPLRQLEPLFHGYLDNRWKGFQNLTSQLSPLFVAVVPGRAVWQEGETHSGTPDIEIL